MNHPHHKISNSVVSLNRTAVQATLHCLLGCGIGEVLGLLGGAAWHWSNAVTVVVSIVLAFLCGYSLSLRSVLRAQVPLRRALLVVLAADTLSIVAMELCDTATVLVIPGAMQAGLNNGLFWLSLALALAAAFAAAWPVNRWLLGRGQGHALLHTYHHGQSEHH